jgi:hypothetical protein
MIKPLTLCGLIVISTYAFADTMTCKIQPWRAATRDGLAPNDPLSLTANVVPYEKSNSPDLLKSCKAIQLDNKKLELCVKEANIIGGYEVVLVTTEQGDDSPTFSSYLLATKRNGQGLVVVDNSDEVMGSVLEKMAKAKLNMPNELKDDTTKIVDAVKKGIGKGVIKENDLILLSILPRDKNCKLN